MAKQITYFPYPIGVTTCSSATKYVLDLARDLYCNYVIENPTRDSYRAISYAITFWESIPDTWKTSITGDEAEIHINYYTGGTGNTTP